MPSLAYWKGVNNNNNNNDNNTYDNPSKDLFIP